LPVKKAKIEAQVARQTEQAKLQLSEQAKLDFEEERQRISEQAERELDDARHRLAEARRQAADAAVEIERAKMQAAAEAQQQVEAAKHEAERQVLAVFPPAPAEQASSPTVQAALPAMDPTDVARLLQAHLKRIGCDPGVLDGTWTEGSRRALDDFNKHAGKRFDLKTASLDALEAVRKTNDRVCPLVCGNGKRIAAARCVPVVCEAHFVPDDRGVCRKRPVSSKKPNAISRDLPASHMRPPSDTGKQTGCHSFEGNLYCQ
jgi:hypothetical protein